jgi:hypothetical protein
LDLWFELYEDGKMIERYYESNTMYIHTPESIRKLLSENKFKVIGFYGGYEKQKFNQNSKIMVIIAKPISK